MEEKGRKMIPKKIHYCWFGGNPLPPMADKCITSWSWFCPGYEIVRWDERNYDLDSTPLYVQQAYEKKKWAFVADYVRLSVVFEQGGIYLDTDVELNKSLDPLLENRAYFGFEDGKNINTGLGFGAEKGHPILQELMHDYMHIPFILENGDFDLTPCPQRNTEVFLRHGMKQDDSMQLLEYGVKILPSRFLCPIDNRTRRNCKHKDTISTHHYAASWHDASLKKRWRRLQNAHRREDRLNSILHFPNRLLQKILGHRRYENIKKRIKASR